MALYIDGEQVLTTDETFEVIESPITFDDLRAGERYDARKEADDIFTKDCIEGAGKPYVAKTPEGIYKKCEAQPVKAFETYGPVSITKSENGFLYDFGRNNAGVYKLRVNGKYGQKITLDFGELIKDGKIDFSNIAFAGRSRKNYVQHDEYICKEGSQEYMPSFTYHGYRYVYVKGITEEQAPNLLEYIVLHSDIPRTGQFPCSSEMLNKIYQCTLASDLANFYYFPTDCPQREKNGWTGDVMLSAEQLLYTFDCTASMREWLYNVRMAQRPNGSLPGIIPTAGWGYDNGMNGPAWDGALIETTYQLYRFSGNKQIIQENFEAIRLYIIFLKSKINANGLLQFGLGDWCEVGCYEKPSTSNEVTDTLTAINLLSKAEKMFADIGDKDNEIKSFRTSLTEKFKEKYVVQGKVQCATQTAQAMAIENEIFSEEELPSAYAYLRELLFAKDDKFKVGVLGAKDLFGALTAGGMQDIAYKAVVGPEFPSYGYWIEHGATTLWEDFQEITGSGGYVKRKDKRPMNSLNHHFWGSVIAWFYKDIAGLNIVSHHEAQISPKIIAELKWVEAQYANGSQKIKVRWDRETNGDILLKIKNNFFTGSSKFTVTIAAEWSV